MSDDRHGNAGCLLWVVIVLAIIHSGFRQQAEQEIKDKLDSLQASVDELNDE